MAPAFQGYRLKALFLAGLLAVQVPTVLPARAGSDYAPKGTLGFVVTNMDYGLYETKFWDECPEGMAPGNDTIWWNGLNRADRTKLTNSGRVAPDSRENYANVRGENGADICWNPTSVKDAPIREAKGTISYGLNLDGTTDGHATPTTCAHEKWQTSPVGDSSVDNQMYRVLGCVYGWRTSGHINDYANQERRSSGRGLTLIEITGVDDPLNDKDVEVAYYRSLDPMPRDADGNILPFNSYRIDTLSDNTPRYGARSHGSIVNGILRTDPVDAELPFYGEEMFHQMKFRGLRIRLDMTPEGGRAKGVFAGYYDLQSWYDYVKNVEYQYSVQEVDCPAVYEAAHRLADGYPDPTTGKCTAISSAFNIEAAAAFVMHPADGPNKKTVQGSKPIQTALER